MPTTDDNAVPYGQTAAGVDAAEDFAERSVSHLLGTAEIANLDLVITSLFALSEILANLEYHAGISAHAAIKQVASFTEDRIAFLQVEHEDCTAQDDGDAGAGAPVVIH